MDKRIARIIAESEDMELQDLWLEVDRELQERNAKRTAIENPKLIWFSEIYDESKELMESRLAVSGLQTGYRQLDMITGGFDKGEFIVVFGAAGRGKTMFLQNIVHNMAQRGTKCLIISIEMQNKEMGKRLIEMHSFENEIETAKVLPVAFFPSTLAYSRDVIGEYCRHAASEGIELIIIDHIGLLPDLKPERRESYSAWTSFLAKIAKEIDVPIALIQHTVKLSQDAQEPQLRDIAETSTTENNVDMAIAVWQEDDSRKVMVKVKKNRLKGRTSAKPLVFEKQVPSFKLLEEGGQTIIESALAMFSKPKNNDDLPDLFSEQG